MRKFWEKIRPKVKLPLEGNTWALLINPAKKHPFFVMPNVPLEMQTLKNVGEALIGALNVVNMMIETLEEEQNDATQGE